jgi:hypothetical protein
MVGSVMRIIVLVRPADPIPLRPLLNSGYTALWRESLQRRQGDRTSALQRINPH